MVFKKTYRKYKIKQNKTLEIIMDSKNKRLKIYNGRVITPYRLIENGTVLIDEGKIVRVCAGDIDFPGSQTIDAQYNYVSPGFIDLHTHVGVGHDFMD